MAKEFGWAYVAGTQASGPKGSIQLAGSTTALEHDPNLLWSDEDNALHVSAYINSLVRSILQGTFQHQPFMVGVETLMVCRSTIIPIKVIIGS